MVTVEKLSAILRKAEALVGEPLGEYGEDLTSIAVMLACGWCNREDIPEDMEGAVALMVAALVSRAFSSCSFFVLQPCKVRATARMVAM